MVEIRPLTFAPMVWLRLFRPSDEEIAQTSAALGFPLPLHGHELSEGAFSVARLTPCEWLFRDGAPAEQISRSLRSILHHASQMEESVRGWRLEGAGAAHIINSACSLDLRDTVFTPRRITRTLLAQVPIVLSRPARGHAFEFFADRSYEHYLEAWLSDAQNLVRPS